MCCLIFLCCYKLRLFSHYILSCDNSPKNCKIDASFDAGWQKRGSGRAYNSLSGIMKTEIIGIMKNIT